MTTTYDWLEERDRAIKLFNGDTPGSELEHAIVNHFTEHPARVHTAIESVGRRVANGNIRSGWAILRTELDTKPEHVQATDTAERIRAIQQARKWIANAGGYIDRQHDLEAALFEDGYGDKGQSLKTWAKDDNLRASMIAYWLEQRPRFQAAEAEAERRQAELAALLRRLRKASAGAQDPDLHAGRILDALTREGDETYLAWADTVAPDPDAEPA